MKLVLDLMTCKGRKTASTNTSGTDDKFRSNGTPASKCCQETPHLLEQDSDSDFLPGIKFKL